MSHVLSELLQANALIGVAVAFAGLVHALLI